MVLAFALVVKPRIRVVTDALESAERSPVHSLPNSSSECNLHCGLAFSLVCQHVHKDHPTHRTLSDFSLMDLLNQCA